MSSTADFNSYSCAAIVQCTLARFNSNLTVVPLEEEQNKIFNQGIEEHFPSLKN